MDAALFISDESKTQLDAGIAIKLRAAGNARRNQVAVANGNRCHHWSEVEEARPRGRARRECTSESYAGGTRADT